MLRCTTPRGRRLAALRSRVEAAPFACRGRATHFVPSTSTYRLYPHVQSVHPLPSAYVHVRTRTRAESIDSRLDVGARGHLAGRPNSPRFIDEPSIVWLFIIHRTSPSWASVVFVPVPHPSLPRGEAAPRWSLAIGWIAVPSSSHHRSHGFPWYQASRSIVSSFSSRIVSSTSSRHRFGSPRWLKPRVGEVLSMSSLKPASFLAHRSSLAAGTRIHPRGSLSHSLTPHMTRSRSSLDSQLEPRLNSSLDSNRASTQSSLDSTRASTQIEPRGSTLNLTN